MYTEEKNPFRIPVQIKKRSKQAHEISYLITCYNTTDMQTIS
jgi:hypothetical protein